MRILSDGGGIYTLGCQPGTVLRGNLIHHVSVNAGHAESNGLFIDEGSSEILIEANTIYNIARSPIRFHEAVGNTLRHNVLVTSGGTPPFRYNATDADSMTYEANTPPVPSHCRRQSGTRPRRDWSRRRWGFVRSERPPREFSQAVIVVGGCGIDPRIIPFSGPEQSGHEICENFRMHQDNGGCDRETT